MRGRWQCFDAAGRVVNVLALAVGAAFVAAGPAQSATGIPAAYGAMVVEPVRSAGKVEFDLTPALERARREGKSLYVYIGADNCPYCRVYEAFLATHADALAPEFEKHKYLVVDLRSSLSITQKLLHFRVGADSRAYSEFQNHIGDERARQLVYPSVWLLNGQAKPLMQMPAGTGTFQTVPEQLEILRLEQ